MLHKHYLIVPRVMQGPTHPNLHQESLPFPHEPCPVDEDSSNSVRQLNVSSLQNVVCQRNIGIDHYSSDFQLPQFVSQDNSFNNSGRTGMAERQAGQHQIFHSGNPWRDLS